jgi:heptosyltransferase II
MAFQPFSAARILVRATNWVGDALMSLPAIRAVRERFPRAHLAVLARPWVAGLYARERAIDEVIPYTASGNWRNLAGRREAAGKLRDFDCAILLPNSFDAALLAWLAGIPTRIGYRRDWRRWLLTDAVTPPEPGEIPRHERFYYLELLRRAGLLDEYPPSPFIRLDGVEAARAAGKARLMEAGLEGPVVGVSPGAAYGGAKRWPADRFAAAAERVAGETGGSVALFGSGGERALCEAIAAGLRARAHNFAGRTSLQEFVELAAACAVFLTNDSGAMHVASAVGTPTVAVFGATDDTTTGPTGPLARVVREHAECSPCLLRECPIDHRCMTRVSADRVVREALGLMREASA